MRILPGQPNSHLPGPFGLDGLGVPTQDADVSKRSEEAGPSPVGPTGVDAQLLAVHQAYIDRARAVPEVNAQAVADAREALRDGRLDTPDARARLAERLLEEAL